MIAHVYNQSHSLFDSHAPVMNSLCLIVLFAESKHTLNMFRYSMMGILNFTQCHVMHSQYQFKNLRMAIVKPGFRS